MSDDVIKLEDPGGSSILLDHRYFPILIHEWNGQTTVELVKSYFDVRQEQFTRAKTEGKKIIIISDLSKAETPPATVRKYIGERSRKDDEKAGDLFIGYVVSVPNAIVRGVVTALKWISGDVKPTVMASSLPDAFEKARKSAESNNVDVPSFQYTPLD